MADPTAIIRQLYRAQLRGELDVVLALLAEGATWIEPVGSPCEGVHVGPRAVERALDRLDADWRDWVASDEVYLSGGDTVVVRGTCYGTYRLTGRTMEARFVDVWILRDGRVVRLERSLDTTAVVEAMTLGAAA